MNDKPGSCRYNDKIGCGSKRSCETCGWNPVVKRERMKQFIKMREAGLEGVPSRCPFCGKLPSLDINVCGAIIRCTNPRCRVASTGYRHSVAKAASMWEMRAGVRKVDAS